MLSPRRTTLLSGSGVAVRLMVMPLAPATTIPPNVPLQSIVIDLLIVRLPKPPGSIQLISPLVSVWEIAAAKVLQGAERLHPNEVLLSSPTPDTQVRVAWALAGADSTTGAKNPSKVKSAMRRMISSSLCAEVL